MSTLLTEEALVAEGAAALESLPTDVLITAIQVLKAMRSSFESTEVKIAVGELVKAGGWGSVNLRFQGGRMVGVSLTVDKRL